jgi:predicted Zn finger-like uncharacterized protein
MEFRCPACDTSYRVPVQLGQQVRCARCNHVWRVAEADFVIANETPEEGEMPDEFSEAEPGTASGEDAGLREVRDSLSTLFDGSGQLSDVSERAAEATRSQETVPDDWPGGEWRRENAETDAEIGPPPETASQFSPASITSAEEPSGPEGSESSDELANVRAAFTSHGPADENSPQKQIADSWFGRTDAAEAEDAADNGHEGSFERIMEGIEEVIAETSKGEHVGPDNAGDPLSALIRGESAPEAQGMAQPHEGRVDDADPNVGKVVQFTSPGSGQRPAEAASHNDSRPDEARNTHGASGAQMTDMADHSGAYLSEDLEEREAIKAEADGFFTMAGDETAADQIMAGSQAEFDDLRDDRDEAGRGALGSIDDPYERAPRNGDEGYYDPSHDAAQRDSLAFSAYRDDFAADEDDGDEWADDAAMPFETAGPAEERERGYEPDERTGIDAREDMANDDALLAEYDFGDETPEESLAPEIASRQAKRGPGVLVVATAWTVFVAVLAGAGWSAIAFRERVVEALPASEPVYAAIGFPVSQTPLALEDVSYALKGEPANVVTLTGRVKHTGRSLIEMPNLKITVRDEADQTVLEDSRFLGQAAMLPGETMEFEIDLDVPAERLRTVELKF